MQELISCTAKQVLPNKVKVDGSLTLTPTQLIWEPEELSQAQPVTIGIKTIKGAGLACAICRAAEDTC